MCPLRSHWVFGVLIMRIALQGRIPTQQGSLHKKKSNQKLIWLNRPNPFLMLLQTTGLFKTTWYTKNASSLCQVNVVYPQKFSKAYLKNNEVQTLYQKSTALFYQNRIWDDFLFLDKKKKNNFNLV